MTLNVSLSRAYAVKPPKGFARSKRGGAALEFAIVAPVLMMLLLGIFVYGGYFLVAHTTQQLANDAARAAAEWTAGALDAAHLEVLRSLPQGPMQVNGDVEICHGAPFDEDSLIRGFFEVL